MALNVQLLAWLGVAWCGVVVSGHGYMKSPPARNSAWRYGFDTPVNYDDNQLFCGGREYQHFRNSGRCGVCGDPWDLPLPRPHERGGKFGQGVITANYTEAQAIPVTIHVSANHKGYYEFRLCKNNNAAAPDSQLCLDQLVLQLADGSGSKYQLDGSIQGDHQVWVLLPRGATCTSCVLQWTWTVGNNWGDCVNGTRAPGCGMQETFINCADVAIRPKGYRPDKPAEDRPKPSQDKSKPSHIQDIASQDKPKPSDTQDKPVPSLIPLNFTGPIFVQNCNCSCNLPDFNLGYYSYENNYGY